MFKAKPKSDKANLLKKVVLAILPGLAVFGLVFAANTYYDIDLRKIIIEESQKIIGQLETTATTTLATISGFVGIGTTTPATTLTVYGTSTFMGGKVGIGTTGPTAALTFADGSTINSQGTLTINSSTTNALTLDSGTTGAINIGINANGKAITLGNSTATTSLVIDSGTGGINIGTSTVARTINIGTGAAVVQTINLGGTGANVVGIGNTQTGGSLSFGAAMTTGTITIGGTGLQTGTIGIGTGSGAQAINLGTGTVGGGAKTIMLGSTAATSSVTIQSGTGNIMLMPTGTGKVGIGTTTPNEMLTVWGGAYFGTSSTPTLYIASSTGRVGIGTSTPATALQVYGRIRMNEFQLGTSATSGYVLTTDPSGVGTWLAAPGGGLSGGQANYIPLWINATTQGTSTIYQSGGYIGIGTTTPATLLHLRGFSDATYLGLTIDDENVPQQWFMGTYDMSPTLLVRDVTAGQVRMAVDSSGNVGIGTSTPATLFTVATTSNIFNVLSNGRVGIGTTTPTSKLDIDSVGSSGNIWRGTRGTSQMAAYQALDSTGYLGMISNNDLNIISNNAARMTIKNDGNVGIGTSTPATLFTVATTSNIFNVLSNGRVGIGTSSPSVGKLQIASGNIIVDSTYGIDLSAAGTLALGDTTATTINVGTNATGRTINVGGTGANTIAVGNTQTAGSIAMGAAMLNGTITIGGTGAHRGVLTFGTSTNANIVSVGTGSGSTTLNLATGVTNAKFINIGTGAAMANTIAIGGTGANVITIGNTQTAGSIAMGAAMTTGTTTIGGTGAQTGTISIGIGTGAQTINLGSSPDGTGAKTITIGNTQAAGSISMGAAMTTGTITIGGKVGIGTTTPATYAKLTICYTLPCTLPAAASTTLVLGSWDNATSSASIRARGTIASSLSDIGEYVKIEGVAKDYELGDLLEASMSPGIFRKSSQAYSPALIGPVTNASAFIAGAGNVTWQEGEVIDGVILSLSGQVQVKVSTENGPIQVGDPLTSANQPGVAMKATAPGRVIGMALESFDQASSTTGKILVFVNPHWYAGKLAIDGSLATSTEGTTTEGTSIVQGSSNFDEFIQKVKGALASLGLFIENGIVQVRELIAEKIFVKKARIEKIEMVDQTTGEIYCTWIENGEWVKIKEECAEMSTPASGGGSEDNEATTTEEQPPSEEQPSEEESVVEEQPAAEQPTAIEQPAGEIN